MNSTTAHFNKLALAILLSVCGMLLSLSSLAIATDNITYNVHSVESDVKKSSVQTSNNS